MGIELRDANVLLTGASAGIGAALAPLLSERGARLGIVGRRLGRLEEVADRCPGEVDVWALDLGDVEAAERLAVEAWDRFGHLDAMINNAAMPKRRRVQDLTVDELQTTMRVNFESPVRMTMAVLGRMLERDRGQIVNVSSTGGRIGIFQETAYCASKFALTGWTEVLALDLAHTGIDVRLITPGAVATEIWDRPDNERSPFDVEKASPESVAAAIVEAMEGDSFETWFPDMSDVFKWKTEDIDSYLRLAIPPDHD